MKITPEIQKRSEEIQSQLQHIVDLTFKPNLNPKQKYQDCMNVAIFTKLAELELKNEELTKWLAEVNIKLINSSK
jgi:hypothetical protein